MLFVHVNVNLMSARVKPQRGVNARQIAAGDLTLFVVLPEVNHQSACGEPDFEIHGGVAPCGDGDSCEDSIDQATSGSPQSSPRNNHGAAAGVKNPWHNVTLVRHQPFVDMYLVMLPASICENGVDCALEPIGILFELACF
jgi:hypothetical protein